MLAKHLYRYALIAVAAALSVPEAHATAVAINFAALATCTTITNQYPDVTFSLSGGLASGAPQTAYYGTGLSDSPTCGIYLTADSLVAAFTSPASGVTFTFDDEGYNGGNAYYAYDPMGNLITSGTVDPSWPSEPLYDLTAYSDIGSIVWYNGEGVGRSWTQALTTLTYDYGVPEPSSLALLGCAIFGLGALHRKRAWLLFADPRRKPPLGGFLVSPGRRQSRLRRRCAT